MKKNYKLEWYNYIPAIIFYLLSLFLIISVFCSFTIDLNINIIIRIIALSLFLITLLFTLYYHYKSMMISNIIDSDNFLLSPTEEKKNKDNYCNKCETNRPKRSHHCSICGVCILKMDHHCPWIANCVGEKNERDFIYFLFGCCTTTFLVVLITLKYFIEFLRNGGNNYNVDYAQSNFKAMLQDISSCFKYGAFVVSFVVCLSSIFVTWHYLSNNIRYNMTAIEMLKYRNYKECPDFNDNLSENLKSKIKPYPFSNLFNCESNDINDEFKYNNFNEENINLLNKEKEI